MRLKKFELQCESQTAQAFAHSEIPGQVTISRAWHSHREETAVVAIEDEEDSAEVDVAGEIEVEVVAEVCTRPRGLDR